MLFGNGNPWMGGGRPAPMRQRQPAAQPAAQPAPQPAASPYPAPTWLGQTEDGTYSTGLANYYANQLQNQQVPGSVQPTQLTAPTGSPAPAPGSAPTPMPPQGDPRQYHMGRHLARQQGPFGDMFANMFGGNQQHLFGGPAWAQPYMTALNGWIANRPTDPNSLLQWAQSAPQRPSFNRGA